MNSEVNVFHIEKSDILLQGEEVLGTVDASVTPDMPVGNLHKHIHSIFIKD